MTRLVVPVASAGPDATAELDVPALKRRAFDLVLRTEEEHLPHVRTLIEDLRAELARMAPDPRPDPGRESEPASISL